MPAVTPPPPPELPSFNLTTILDDFAAWWGEHTFGLFDGLFVGLFVLSVFLKTRSLSATAVAVAVAAAVVYRSWALIILALTLAGLIYTLWERSGG